MDIPPIPDHRPRPQRAHHSSSILSDVPTIQVSNEEQSVPTSETSSQQFSLDDHYRPASSTSELRSQPSIKSLNRQYAVNELPVLQETNPCDGAEELNPVNEEGSFDLVAPYEGDGVSLHSLERQAELMFSARHMVTILSSPRYLARFRDFLSDERPRSIPTLTYYLNACKALKAIQYANSLVRLSVDVPTAGVKQSSPIGMVDSPALEKRVQDALIALTAEELPAFITATCINITSKVVEERVRGTLPDRFRGTADALAEVFCLTDPSRPDNPIIFASEEFHRTTQYGMDYVLGRNCRFLQGPQTNPNSVRRLREAIQDGRHHSELFLNYRRDGSPFMNLLQCAPLCDSQGKIRYFIGAQIDVSGLAMDDAQMESLNKLKAQIDSQEAEASSDNRQDTKSEFQELGELFSPKELRNVNEHGGSLFQPVLDAGGRTWLMPESPREKDAGEVRIGGTAPMPPTPTSGSLVGVYKHYLLVRPYPSLQVLFTSPSLRIPGILQSPFFSRIAESIERDELHQALMAGRSVTARVLWVSPRSKEHGRFRFVHCTPLLANNGQVGVWMVVIVDDENENVRWTGSWPSN